jgi:hypothetical protein
MGGKHGDVETAAPQARERKTTKDTKNTKGSGITPDAASFLGAFVFFVFFVVESCRR